MSVVATITESIKAQAEKNAPLGGKMKFDFGEGVVYLDGSGDSNVVSNEDADADCVISTSPETFQKMMAGEINGMMAVMSGKVKIKGDMGLAMKLQSLVG